MKIYTRTGDGGETGLFGGPRVPKDTLRLEVCGQLDELNSALGLAAAEPLPASLAAVLTRIQNELFELGAELAAADPEAMGMATVSAAHAARIEADIDRFEIDLPPLRQFILPGGTRPAAALQVARSVCRRAERRLVTLVRNGPEPISPQALTYLNRLGDLLFVMARAANAHGGKPDVPWQRQREGDSGAPFAREDHESRGDGGDLPTGP